MSRYTNLSNRAGVSVQKYEQFSSLGLRERHSGPYLVSLMGCVGREVCGFSKEGSMQMTQHCSMVQALRSQYSSKYTPRSQWG